jgi:hypothetical protein
MATGHLRAPARRAVLVANPAAAARHREKAEKEARVEVTGLICREQGRDS